MNRLVPRGASHWYVRPPAPLADVGRISAALRVPPLLASILHARGMPAADAAMLRPPLLRSGIPNLERAAARLERAVQTNERILIHGDYDADGVTASAILYLGLREQGANVAVFIPNRLTDGYGVAPARVPEFVSRCSLFVTVDCGIGNADEIAELREAGVDVIVTDHHRKTDRTPDGIVVHPDDAPGGGNGEPQLTGAGIAYHLLWTMRERLGREEPLEYSDLATIGTIADVAPLWTDNRALVLAGLERLCDSRWPGVRALVRAALGEPGVVTARSVAFGLGPRLNAAGRLGAADRAFDLLVEGDEARCRELASELERYNAQRRSLQDAMLSSALERVDAREPAVVLNDDAWHPGVMGIVASKLVDRFGVPVFISAQGKGSVRSIDGVHAVRALAAASEGLSRYGGHSQAAGFTLAPGGFERFRLRILEFVAQQEVEPPRVVLDAVLHHDEATSGFFGELGRLEPYGAGHERPCFGIVGELAAARVVGRDASHLQLQVGSLKGISYGNARLAEALAAGEDVVAVGALQENEFRGRTSVEFEAADVAAHAPLRVLGATEVPVGRVWRGADVDGAPAARTFLRLPLERSAPAAAAHEIASALAAGSVRFHLDHAALHEVTAFCAQIPDLGELRVALTYARAGRPSPLAPALDASSREWLRRLEHLDSSGRPQRGVRLHPLDDAEFLALQLERHRLLEFVKAYRWLDDAGFEAAVLSLFAADDRVGSEQPQETVTAT